MENNHPELLSMKTPPSKRPYGSVTKADDFTKRANVLLASLIVTSKESYNFVSNDYLQLFVNHIQSSDVKYIVPSRDSFSQKIIPEMANNVIKQIKEELKSVEGISCTLDYWSKTIDSDSFLSFTIHYLFQNEIKSRVIRLSNEKESHSAENISLFINTVIEDFSLGRFMPFVVVTDNAPNVVKAVKIVI